MKSRHGSRKRRASRGTGAGGVRPGPIHPRDLLAHLKLSARQSMGQNFLVRPDIARAIVQGARVKAGTHVLEVGPGLGALTWALHEAGARVVAVEKDRGLAAFLADQYRDTDDVVIVEGDILTWTPPPAFADRGPWAVVANLPYNIATPIVFRLLESDLPIRDLHVMVQREVAERMTARPGTAAYGVLTIRLGVLSRVEPLLDVPPDAFYPAPNVRSTVVRIVPERRYRTGPEKRFHRLVNGAFARRRKTLRNALLASGMDARTVDTMLERAGIDSRRRGETLSIEEFCRMNQAMEADERTSDGGADPEAPGRRADV